MPSALEEIATAFKLPKEVLTAPLEKLHPAGVNELISVLGAELARRNSYHDASAYRIEQSIGLIVSEHSVEGQQERNRAIGRTIWGSKDLQPVFSHWSVCYGSKLPLTIKAYETAMDELATEKDSHKAKARAQALYNAVYEGSSFVHRALTQRIPWSVADGLVRETMQLAQPLSREEKKLCAAIHAVSDDRFRAAHAGGPKRDWTEVEGLHALALKPKRKFLGFDLGG